MKARPRPGRTGPLPPAARIRVNTVMAEPTTVLVIDDDPLNRRLLEHNLVNDGHRVVTAEDGREGLERIRAEPPDVVLLDILMPEIDGFDVLAQVKADNALRDIPVIMISGLDDFESVIRCIELGAED